MPVRVGLVLLLTMFFGVTFGTQMPLPPGDANMIAAALLMTKELIIGLALGLSVNLVYMSIQQGARIAAQQMGLQDAAIMDPITGEESEAVAMIFETTFALLFLVAGGHRMLLTLLANSYTAFPAADSPDMGQLAGMVLQAGQAMLELALRMGAPMLAAFLVLSVVLAVVSRVLPEINILFASYPLRVGLGLLLAAGMMPLLATFAQDVAQWMGKVVTIPS